MMDGMVGEAVVSTVSAGGAATLLGFLAKAWIARVSKRLDELGKSFGHEFAAVRKELAELNTDTHGRLVQVETVLELSSPRRREAHGK